MADVVVNGGAAWKEKEGGPGPHYYGTASAGRNGGSGVYPAGHADPL